MQSRKAIRKAITDRVTKQFVPVFPRNLLKFDPLDFWIEQFSNYLAVLDSDVIRGVVSATLAKEAGEFADAALSVAEERWGKQKVK
jgi:hypothetical protein